jgi:hypothetical protein
MTPYASESTKGRLHCDYCRQPVYDELYLEVCPPSALWRVKVYHRMCFYWEQKINWYHSSSDFCLPAGYACFLCKSDGPGAAIAAVVRPGNHEMHLYHTACLAEYCRYPGALELLLLAGGT